MSVEANSAPPGADEWQEGHGRRRDRTAIAKQLPLLIMAFLILFPAYFMIITPFKTQIEYGASKLGFPQSLYLGSFDTALRGGRFLLWTGNSIILAVGSVVLSSIVSALAAFAFARMDFKGRTAMLTVVTALMVVPPVVMLIPIFVLYAQLKITSTYAAAIIVYAGLVTPFSVYMLTNFFKTIPHEIVESALIDGASPLDILWRIIMPLSAPALITMIVVNALWVWNDLLIALILLPKDDLRTLMVGITIFGGRYSNDVPVAVAGMLMAALPMFLLYVVGQRYFIHGMVAGAIKG
jgi:ABC-type glycerol-3-phosphate transport system permease component